jgi:hypothetical protein
MKQIYADLLFAGASLIYLGVSLVFLLLNGNGLMWLVASAGALITLLALFNLTLFRSLNIASVNGALISAALISFLAVIAYFSSAIASFSIAAALVILLFGPCVLYDAYYRTLGKEAHKKFVKEISQPVF